MKAKGDVQKAKEMLYATTHTYRHIAAETGCSYGTVAKHGKEIRNKPIEVDDEIMSVYEKRPTERPSKGIVKELERERDGWKAQHDDLLKHYKRLEEELEAYRTDANPQMCSTLNKRINDLHTEIRELHKCCDDADKERDEAKEEAERAKQSFLELHKESKANEAEFHETYLNMKAQIEAYEKIINLKGQLAE